MRSLPCHTELHKEQACAKSATRYHSESNPKMITAAFDMSCPSIFQPRQQQLIVEVAFRHYAVHLLCYLRLCHCVSGWEGGLTCLGSSRGARCGRWTHWPQAASECRRQCSESLRYGRTESPARSSSHLAATGNIPSFAHRAFPRPAFGTTARTGAQYNRKLHSRQTGAELCYCEFALL